MPPLQALLFQIGGGGLVAWLLILTAVLVATRRRYVTPDPPTDDLETCRPAVVNLLVNGWRCTPEAVHATLADLAARGFLDVRRDNGRASVQILDPDPPRLTQYERRLMGRLREHAHGNRAPLEALGFRFRRDRLRWLRRFHAEVAADARARRVAKTGLNTDFLVGAALLPALALAGWTYLEVTGDPLLSAAAVLVAVVVLLLQLASLARDRHRPTPAGRRTAAHWLGVRSYLRESRPELAGATLGDTSLSDEYLPYAVALGLTPGIVAQLDLARHPDDDPAPTMRPGATPTPERP